LPQESRGKNILGLIFIFPEAMFLVLVRLDHRGKEGEGFVMVFGLQVPNNQIGCRFFELPDNIFGGVVIQTTHDEVKVIWHNDEGKQRVLLQDSACIQAIDQNPFDDITLEDGTMLNSTGGYIVQMRRVNVRRPVGGGHKISPYPYRLPIFARSKSETCGFDCGSPPSQGLG